MVEEYLPPNFLILKADSVFPGEAYDYLVEQYHIDTLDFTQDTVETWVDSTLNFKHVEFQQYYKGIPIEGAGYIEHTTQFGSGHVAAVNGSIVREMDIDTSNLLPDSLIVDIVLSSYESATFAWEDSLVEAELKEELNDGNATYYPEPELVIALDSFENINFLISKDHYVIAKKVFVRVLNPNEYATFYVDMNGNIIRKRLESREDGPADVIHSPTSEIIDTRYMSLSNSWRLQTTGGNRNIHTKEHDGWAWAAQKNITDEDDVWTDPSDYDGITAHWAASVAWDYFYDTYRRIGTGMSPELRIVVDQEDSQYGAASYYFDQNKRTQEITLLRETSNPSSFTGTLDVTGHEFTHGIFLKRVHLSIYEHEQGSIEESYCDIMGNMVEWSHEGSMGWEINEDAIAKRDMENPLHYGGAMIYKGLNWGDYSDPQHRYDNAGPMNHWFHLFSSGGNTSNIITHGIGLEEAALVTYYSLTNFQRSVDDYAATRSNMLAVTHLLFGNCSDEHIQNIASWASVGLGSPNHCGYTGIAHARKENVKIYPNPTKNSVTISAKDIKAIELTDIEGILLFNSSYINSDEFTLELSMFPSGVYVLTTHSKIGRKQNKIIKLD